MKRALFLDRDGVINKNRHYVHRTEDFHFIDGIFDLCRAAVGAGMVILIVTNQAGIGRGFFTEQQCHALTDWMNARFADRGVTIDQVYFWPHHPTHGVGDYRRDCSCRKPNLGMILSARDDHGICLKNSILIGDNEWYMAAADAAGIGTAALVTVREMEPSTKARFHCRDLKETLALLRMEGPQSRIGLIKNTHGAGVDRDCIMDWHIYCFILLKIKKSAFSVRLPSPNLPAIA